MIYASTIIVGGETHATPTARSRRHSIHVAMDGRRTKITLPKPDDFHHHLRDGDKLVDTVAACASQFRRAICMPNLVPPVTTAAQASAYKARIYDAMRARGGDPSTFDPLMTLYLTDDTTPEMIGRPTTVATSSP